MAFSYQRTQSSFQHDERRQQDTMEDGSVNESLVFKLSLKDYILRLLILGSSENKYDPRKKGLSAENTEYIKSQISSGHGEEICNVVRDVYKENRAPKQDATMMVIGLLCRAEDITIRKMGLQLLENFKTISHLYSWKKCHASIESHATGQKSKGFGRAVKRQINDWILSYSGKPADLAYQITKYMAREGWSFKNILQCTHVKTGTGDDRVFEEKEGVKTKSKRKVNKNTSPPTELDLVLRYAVNGFEEMNKLATPNLLTTKVYQYLADIHIAMRMTSQEKERLIDIIYKHKLTREQIPTWGLADKEILDALLMNRKKSRVSMPLTALLRNLGNLSTHNIFRDETTLQLVTKHLVHPDTIKVSKIHPVSVLTAWFTYRNGSGNRGHNSWMVDPDIVKTLEEMFYLSFKNVEPTGKRICFLIDCSGSMGCQSLCEGITCAESAALLSMIFARSETTCDSSPDHSFYLFTSKNKVCYGGYPGGGNTGLTDVSDVINADADFNTVLKSCQRSDWGMTDISMGILEALKYKRKYDAFVVITDNDVNSGIKPSEAMKQYRTGMKMPNTKLAVVATQGADYTIADPKDPLMMDMVGFDSHGPKILQDFIRS